MCKCRVRVVTRNWLMRLRKLRSLNRCNQETQESQWYKFHSTLNLKIRSADGTDHSPQENNYVSAFRQQELNLLLYFCSIWVFDGLDEAYPYWTSALLSPLIQMLNFSRNTLKDMSRSNIKKVSCHPVAHSSLYIKLTITSFKTLCNISRSILNVNFSQLIPYLQKQLGN